MRIAPLAVLAAALLVPAGASAQDYPEPKNPGKVAPKPRGPFETHTVCKRRGCDFRSIQRAVNAADPGDTVRVRPGTYREAVRITGNGKRYLKLIGSPGRPGRVVLRARGSMQNGVAVTGADEVTVNGFTARGYKANGFFFTSVNGYTMTNLVAARTGVYGMFAFNSIGGRITRSRGSEVSDGAFYIGQTPPQDRPVQTMVRNVVGHTSAIGFSGTNMRYVTITDSRFYNNAIGIVPSALDTEKYPPPVGNVITRNEVFWNNFDYRRGDPPFTPRTDGASSLFPVGVGILLIGGRDQRVEDNEIYGNWLAGIGAFDSILVPKIPAAATLDRNVIRGNAFGRGGADLNGRDIAYDGSGSDNCISLEGVGATMPEDRSTFATCTGKNPFSQAARDTILSWAGNGSLAGWIRHPHAPNGALRPIEVVE